MVFGAWANRYYESGYMVLPLVRETRAPAISHDYTNTEDQIEKWSKEYQDYGIGLITGKNSNVIAIDFDYTGPDVKVIEKALLNILPPSPVRKIGYKGWTAFYKYSEIESIQIKRGDFVLVDILSDKKYTVLPPSYHPKAKKNYFWDTEDTLLDIHQDDLPELPSGITQKIIELSEIDLTDKSNPISERSGRHYDIALYAWANIDKVSNHEELAQLMIDYDVKNFSDNRYFLDKKYFRNINPMDAALDIAFRLEKSTIKRRKDRFGVDWKLGGEKLGDNLKCFYFEDKKDNGKSIWRPLYKDMASFYREKKNYVASKAGDWKYKNGSWKSVEDLFLMNEIFKHNHQHLSPSHIDNFKKMIRSNCFKDSFEFKSTEGLINLNNGILNTKTGLTTPHSNEYFFKYKVPISFDKSAKCEKWNDYLNSVFNSDEDLKTVCKKIFGYCLVGGNPFLHKAFVLYGNGRNGKSVFLYVLRKILGQENISTVSLSALDKPFSLVSLDGKLANIVEETPNSEINSEIFKTVTSGGIVTAARKGFDEYSLEVNARFIFACNDMPIFKDKNESMLERLFFIPFKKFLKEDERDTEIYSKLDTELSGILNWALEGVKLILEDRSIKAVKAIDDLKEEYRRETDSFYVWFNDSITFTNGAKPLPSSVLYEKYKEDMKNQGNHALNGQNFFKRFKKMAIEECTRLKVKFDFDNRVTNHVGQRVRGYDFVVYHSNFSAEHKSENKNDLSLQ